MAKHEPEKIKVRWKGPYGWPKYEGENDLPRLPNVPGVYLGTFEYKGGYLIYAAGHTGNTFPKRFKQHTRFYMNGKCTVLDIAAARQGDRCEIYHGWGHARRHPEVFEERKPEILDAVRKQLAGFRILVTDTGSMNLETRVRERLEAAIMDYVYEQPPPICCIPDRRMNLRPRRTSENPIIVENECAALLHGLPDLLKI